jgi:DNA-binding beta-propeller fold protein YncE
MRACAGFAVLVAGVLGGLVAGVAPAAGAATPGITAWWPAASAELDLPQGIAVNAAGNLVIADTENGRVRLVSN